MIPKIIHWLWFGDKNKIPDQFQQNLASWKRFFPDYEIKLHDENNYDVNKNPFTKEQYKKGNFAFVSDFARLDIIYQEGGLYFDIDVEVIRPFDDLPEQFFCFEACTFGINPGSGFRCESGHPLFKKTIDSFNTRSVIGEYFKTRILTTEEPSLTLIANGLIPDNTYQIIQETCLITH
jgi:mannosyltransferase OCH1-like enzyme